jgi:preprotein translocase subunit YajC
MFSGNPFILFIGVISFVLFFFLLGMRASKKQRDRNNKINWSWFWKKK